MGDGKADYRDGRKRLNRAVCGSCKEILISTHRHDFVTCSCGKLSVDGGSAYLRRVFSGPWRDISEGFTIGEGAGYVHPPIGSDDT